MSQYPPIEIWEEILFEDNVCSSLHYLSRSSMSTIMDFEMVESMAWPFRNSFSLEEATVLTLAHYHFKFVHYLQLRKDIFRALSVLEDEITNPWFERRLDKHIYGIVGVYDFRSDPLLMIHQRVVHFVHEEGHFAFSRKKLMFWGIRIIIDAGYQAVQHPSWIGVQRLPE